MAALIERLESMCECKYRCARSSGTTIQHRLARRDTTSGVVAADMSIQRGNVAPSGMAQGDRRKRRGAGQQIRAGRAMRVQVNASFADANTVAAAVDVSLAQFLAGRLLLNPGSGETSVF
jgi:hypothetical protein